MIAIINGCGNNIASIQYALTRLNMESILTDDKQIITNASHVILPGVGHAKTAMQKLHALELTELIPQLTQPVLAICLGMQLLYEYTEEGNTPCLGIIPGNVRKMNTNNGEILPHMGWNTVNFCEHSNKLSTEEANHSYAYFVHSYVAAINDYTISSTEYTEKFTSIVQHNNFIGMQFHPEKSATFGEQLLTNFINMRTL